jgi:hypothetical protein
MAATWRVAEEHHHDLDCDLPFFFLFLLAGLVLNTTSNRELSHQVGIHAIEMPRAAITCR